MKGQWGLLFGIVFALIIALFSVFNVAPVTVNYLFGEARWPLILVILSSVLMGGLMVGSIGLVRVFRLQRTVKHLDRELETSRTEALNVTHSTKGDSNEILKVTNRSSDKLSKDHKD